MDYIYNIFTNINKFCFKRGISLTEDKENSTDNSDNKNCDCLGYETDIEDYLSDNESIISVSSAIYYDNEHVVDSI